MNISGLSYGSPYFPTWGSKELRKKFPTNWKEINILTTGARMTGEGGIAIK
jgi:hypothetical protein